MSCSVATGGSVRTCSRRFVVELSRALRRRAKRVLGLSAHQTGLLCVSCRLGFLGLSLEARDLTHAQRLSRVFALRIQKRIGFADGLSTSRGRPILLLGWLYHHRWRRTL